MAVRDCPETRIETWDCIWGGVGVGLICRVAKCLKPFSKEANRAIESREMFAMPVQSAIDTYINSNLEMGVLGLLL